MNPFCLCGCGKEVTNPLNRFMKGHQYKGKHPTPETILKRKDTWNKLFGGNPMLLEKIKNKKDDLFFLKHGVRNPSNLPDVVRKREKSYFEKNKYKNPFSNPFVIIAIANTNNERYGGTGYASFELAKRCGDTLEEKTGYRYPSQVPEIIKKVSDRRKQTFINNGKWLPDDQISNYQLYYKKVYYHTYKSIKKTFNKEEIANRKLKRIHIDHKYSVHQGFIDGILPYIIGSACNLEILSIEKNSSKGSKCSISKEELFLLNKQTNQFT